VREIKQIRFERLGRSRDYFGRCLIGSGRSDRRKIYRWGKFLWSASQGSACSSEIVFANSPIDYPLLVTTDILVAMSQGAYDIYFGEVREPSGLIIYDNGLLKPRKELNLKQVGVPATEYAVKRLKDKQVANMVILGVLIETAKIVSQNAIRKAITLHVSERFRNLNLRALRIGMELGKQIND